MTGPVATAVAAPKAKKSSMNHECLRAQVSRANLSFRSGDVVVLKFHDNLPAVPRCQSAAVLQLSGNPLYKVEILGGSDMDCRAAWTLSSYWTHEQWMLSSSIPQVGSSKLARTLDLDRSRFGDRNQHPLRKPMEISTAALRRSDYGPSCGCIRCWEGREDA